MKADEKPTRIYPTLKGLEEELHPKGEKVATADLEGQPMLIQEFKAWTGDNGEAVFVTATVMETGQRVSFNAGKPVLETLRKYEDALPFVATLRKIETRKGRTPWILE